MTLHTQRPGYRFTLQCWQAREVNGHGRKKGGRCGKDKKIPTAACILRLQTSRENVQKCVCLGGEMRIKRQAVSACIQNPGNGSPQPSAISNPVAMCWGRCLWQYDILGPLLERQR